MLTSISKIAISLLYIFFFSFSVYAQTARSQTQAGFACLDCNKPQKIQLLDTKQDLLKEKAKNSCRPLVKSEKDKLAKNNSSTFIVSFYGKGDGFAGKQTANGEKFNPFALTAAHRSLPFGSKVIVRSLKSGLMEEVRINDRGPFVHGRTLDLSYQAAKNIGVDGVGQVEIFVCM